MDIKSNLRAHADLLKKIRMCEQRIETLSESLALPKTTNTTRTSVQGGEIFDRLPLKLNQIDELRCELEGLHSQREFEHETLWPLVDSLANNLESGVLQSYYFYLMNREDTAFHLFGHEDDFGQRRSNYLQRVSRLHSSAIANLKKSEQAKITA